MARGLPRRSRDWPANANSGWYRRRATAAAGRAASRPAGRFDARRHVAGGAAAGWPAPLDAP
ncbi:hypothetical protein CFB49_21855 [Burkholderia sp. AU17457]|nr:hypothetical protein CFB49_21855 [Burkholderia sp. AU17457]